MACQSLIRKKCHYAMSIRTSRRHLGYLSPISDANCAAICGVEWPCSTASLRMVSGPRPRCRSKFVHAFVHSWTSTST